MVSVLIEHHVSQLHAASLVRSIHAHQADTTVGNAVAYGDDVVVLFLVDHERPSEVLQEVPDVSFRLLSVHTEINHFRSAIKRVTVHVVCCETIEDTLHRGQIRLSETASCGDVLESGLTVVDCLLRLCECELYDITHQARLRLPSRPEHQSRLYGSRSE